MRGDTDHADRRVAAGEGELERQLVEPVGTADVAQPDVSPASGPSGVSIARPRPGDDVVRRRRAAGAPARRCHRARPAQLAVEVGGGEVGVLEDGVDERADAAPPGIAASGSG